MLLEMSLPSGSKIYEPSPRISELIFFALRASVFETLKNVPNKLIYNTEMKTKFSVGVSYISSLATTFI